MSTRPTLPRWLFVDANGNPRVGAKLYTSETGTSTPKPTYSDAGLTVPNANPMISDADGYFSDIFLASGAYRFRLTTSADAQIWQADNIEGGSTALPLTGGVMTGFITLHADPTQPLHAVTKQYVDNKIPVSVKDYGAVGNGSTDDTAAVQAAVDAVIAGNGGSLFFPRGAYLTTSTIVVDPSLAPQGSASVRLFGEGRLRSSLISNTAGQRVLEFRGARGSLEHMSVYNNNFTTSTTGDLMRLNNTQQFSMRDCWLQGGYHCLYIFGDGCTDSNIVGCSFTFASGNANVRIQRPGTTGQNGAHRFRGCLFNQGWPVSNPSAANMKGARANTTAYNVGDVVETSFGGLTYRIQARVGGTSGGSAPSAPSFYGVDITDGTVQWRLVGQAAYRGALLDGQVFYTWFDQCDFTGPYLSGVSFEDTVATGTFPYTCWVTNCTIHGPVTNGVSVGTGVRDIAIQNCDFLPLNDISQTAISFGTGQANQAIGNRAYDYATGIVQGGSRGALIGNLMTGGTIGIDLTGASATTRVIGNEVGTRTVGGANGTGIRLQSGATRHIVMGNVAFGATTPINDSSGSGTNIIANNVTT